MLHIQDSYFAMNKAKDGGVICADTDSEVIIDSSEFINNSASSAGGVLAVIWRNVQITITYSIFTNNRAERGGVIDVLLEIQTAEALFVILMSLLVD